MNYLRRCVLQHILGELVRDLIHYDERFAILSDFCKHVSEDAYRILLGIAVAWHDLRQQAVRLLNKCYVAETPVPPVLDLHGLGKTPHDKRHDKCLVLRRLQLLHLKNHMMVQKLREIY